MLMPTATFRSQGPAPYANPPIAGYTFWLDADDPASMTFVNGRVTQWRDKSGNGNHFTVGGEGNAPYFRDARFGGRQVVNLTGFNSFTSSVPASDTSSTSFFVGVCQAFGANRALIASSTSGANQWLLNSSGQLITFRAQVQEIGTLSTPVVVAGVPFVATQLVEPTQLTQWLNYSSETDVVAPGFTAGTFGLGTDGSAVFYGCIAEALFYSTSLSVGDVTTTIAYLRAKWSI